MISAVLHAIGTFIPRAFAADSEVWGQYCEVLGNCGEGRAFLIDLAIRSTNLIFMLIGGASVIAVIYGGIKVIVSMGGDQGRDEAKKILIYAVTGLVFSMMAMAIVQYVAKITHGIVGQ